jgi:hypothetical protein
MDEPRPRGPLETSILNTLNEAHARTAIGRLLMEATPEEGINVPVPASTEPAFQAVFDSIAALDTIVRRLGQEVDDLRRRIEPPEID